MVGAPAPTLVARWDLRAAGNAPPVATGGAFNPATRLPLGLLTSILHAKLGALLRHEGDAQQRLWARIRLSHQL